MSTTATTPSELFESIDSTIRNQTAVNSITPETHSNLLYNMVEVLSAVTLDNTFSGTTTIENLNLVNIGSGTSVTNLGVDSSGNVVSGTTGGSSYLVYTALLTQTGTNAPVATVLENTLNITPDHIYDGVGSYIFSANTATFTNNKTTISFGSSVNDGVTNFAYYVVLETVGSSTEIYYTSYGDTNTQSNDIFLNTLFEVRVYN